MFTNHFLNQTSAEYWLAFYQHVVAITASTIFWVAILYLPGALTLYARQYIDPNLATPTAQTVEQRAEVLACIRHLQHAIEKYDPRPAEQQVWYEQRLWLLQNHTAPHFTRESLLRNQSTAEMEFAHDFSGARGRILSSLEKRALWLVGLQSGRALVTRSISGRAVYNAHLEAIMFHIGSIFAGRILWSGYHALDAWSVLEKDLGGSSEHGQRADTGHEHVEKYSKATGSDEYDVVGGDGTEGPPTSPETSA